jgi:tRNA(adenine34) deaminase
VHPRTALMEKAVAVALAAELSGNYRIGALVANAEGDIISTAYTQLDTTVDPTAHGEIMALREACERAGSRYLPGHYLYSTLEPCPMCTSAAIWAKLGGIVFGASLEDALERGRHTGRSWRQIRLKAEQVIEAGDPVLELHPGYLRDRCLYLIGGTEE